jgi:hypothetical protein
LLAPLRATAAVNCDELGVLKTLPGICGAEDFNAVINAIVTWLMGILGVVLAIVILVSAVQIVSSGGSPEAIKSAKSRLTQAAVSLGLLISFRAILALLGVQ